VVLLWAAYCLGFFGFMRAGEFTYLSDSQFDPESMLTPDDIPVDKHQSSFMSRPDNWCCFQIFYYFLGYFLQ
jgi:hypothetical protein